MRKILLVPFLFFGQFVFGQHQEDKTECFQNQIDSVVIHAAKSGCHAVTIEIVPYEGKQIFPKDYKQGEVINTTWTEVKSEEEDRLFGRIKITWTFLNDSMVKEQVGSDKYYGRIKNGKIYECDKNGGEIKQWEKITERDSAGYIIRESSISFRNRPLFQYTKEIIDTADHVVEIYYCRDGRLLNYDTFTYSSDFSWTEKTFAPVQDSITYGIYTNAKDSIQRKIWNAKRPLTVKEWCVPQKDSLALIAESHIHKIINKDRSLEVDTFVSVSYDIYGLSNPFNTNDLSTIGYTYDGNGRLIGAEELNYSDGSLYWKNEMTVIYEK